MTEDVENLLNKPSDSNKFAALSLKNEKTKLKLTGDTKVVYLFLLFLMFENFE